MITGLERDFYRNVARIEQHLETIAEQLKRIADQGEPRRMGDPWDDQAAAQQAKFDQGEKT